MTFSDELREYLIEALYAHPADDRRRSHWVMDPEWLQDIRRIEVNGLPLWMPTWSLGSPDLLLGLPIEPRKGAGAPHLEQAGA